MKPTLTTHFGKPWEKCNRKTTNYIDKSGYCRYSISKCLFFHSIHLLYPPKPCAKEGYLTLSPFFQSQRARATKTIITRTHVATHKIPKIQKAPGFAPIQPIIG